MYLKLVVLYYLFFVSKLLGGAMDCIVRHGGNADDVEVEDRGGQQNRSARLNCFIEMLELAGSAGGDDFR